jgi:hypothetical protein
MQLQDRRKALPMARRIRSADRTRIPRRGQHHGCTTLCPMSPRRINYRRLVEMSATAEPDQPSAPATDLPTTHTYPFTITVGENDRYIQRLECDEQDRLVEFAVIQQRYRNGRWQRVALYDVCHDKGLHLHLYDRREREFTQVSLMAVTCQKDVEDGFDYVMEHLIRHWWHENERRSDCGH